MGAPIRRIKVLELRNEHADLLMGAILPWHGTVLIASLLRSKGFDVEALVEGISRFSEQELCEADAVLVHVTAGNIARTEQVVQRIRRTARVPIICGGALTKVVPSAVANTCDFIVRGEGEDTVLELITALNQRKDIRSVAGVSLRREGNLQHTGSRAFTRSLDTHHLRVNASFLAGSDHQCADDVKDTVEWAIDHGVDYLNLFALTPIQMQENLCIPRERLLAPSWDYMNGNYVTFFPARMRPSTLQLAINDGLLRFYSASSSLRHIRRYGAVNDRWHWPASLLASNVAARRMDRRMRSYIQYLRGIEAPYYDADDRLPEERLPTRGVSCLPFMDGADIAVSAKRRLATAAAFSASHCSAPAAAPERNLTGRNTRLLVGE